MSTSIRHDAFTFYSLATVSFLESTVATYVENLFPYFEEDPAALNWLQTVWLREEAEHGRLTQTYLRATWPDFDWQQAYEEFLQSYVPRCDSALLRPSPALEALARCVTETQTSMIYRCFGDYFVDPHLTELMQRLSREEVRHYKYFRRLFEKYERLERNSLWRKIGTLVSRSALVRDEDVALAFRPLNRHWRGAMPFAPMSYRDFLSRAGQVMRRHFPFEEAKRMLFRPLRSGAWHEKLLVDCLSVVVKRQYPHLT